MATPFLGIGDLRQRWQFTRQGIHQRRKLDKQFPHPVAHINNGRDAVFQLSDIEAYETLRPHLTQSGGWDFRQSKDEWNNLNQEERKARRDMRHVD